MLGVCMLAGVLMVSLSTPAHAAECAEPKASMVEPIENLIERSDRIVVAELAMPGLGGDSETSKTDIKLDREKELAPVLESRSDDRTITQLGIIRFRVIENVKGEGPAYIFIPGRISREEEATIAHDASFFEDPHAGRSNPNQKCKIEPSFKAGTNYLIFTGSPHVKGYEEVQEGDQWLSYIRERVAED